MDAIDGFDLTKENIQPLAQGRKTLQFEAALHAQNNPEAHRELSKIAENYELELRTYEGDDPLALWYEYICWVEQSFPKGGKEGNLCPLLEKCLTLFKDNKAYFQDGRLVRLWIKYIDGNYEGKRAELYSMAHCHGVGTQSALFYRFWAYELERSGDHKNAGVIYKMGIDHNAQPKEELVSAYNNFLAALGQMVLDGSMPSPQRPDASDRKVLAALRANSKNQVPNKRLGGAVNTRLDRRPMSLSGNQVQPAAIKIFNDDGENTDLNFPRESMRSLPKNAVVNKENSLSAGPWTGPPRRKTQPAPSTLSQPTRPAFQVHTDEVSPTPREPPRGIVMNALKPIHDDAFDNVPCAVFEEPNPNQRRMYPKSEVYAGGIEFSLEELRAARWLKKEGLRIAIQKQEQEAQELAAAAARLAAEKEKNASAILKLSHGTSSDSIPSRINTENDSLEALQLSEQKDNPFRSHSRISKKSSSNQPKKSLQNDARRKTMFFTIFHNQSTEPHRQFVPEDGIGSYSGESKTIDRSALRAGDSSQPSTNVHLRNPTVFPNESCSSTEPSMLHSQSITVNTKEAMSVMNELWGSTCDRGQLSCVSTGKKDFDDTTYVVHVSALLHGESRDEHVNIPVMPTTSKPEFTIFTDCESQSNVLRSTLNDFSVNAAVDESHSKENVGYNRKPFSVAVDSEEEDDDDEFVVQNTANSLKNNFVIYEESNDAQQKNQDVSVMKSYVETRNEFVVYQESDDAQLKDGDMSAQKTDDPKNDFAIYQEEEEDQDDLMSPWPKTPLPAGIPLVPSPGMTPAQVRALQGTEHKENVLVEFPPEDERQMAGVLQPSIGIPFKPVDEMEREEAGENLPEPTEYFTQAFTQAFDFPLLSSTPFHSNNLSPVVEAYEASSPTLQTTAKQGTDAMLNQAEQQAECLPARAMTAPGPMNLSVIMENSKETYRSSSSSGSSYGTTTRPTFSVSTWSTQESMQRTGREKSLAAIQELNKESLSDHEDDVNREANCAAEMDGFSLSTFRSVHTEVVNDAGDLLKEDLFTVGIFNLTSKRDVQSCDRNSDNCFEERHIKQSDGDHSDFVSQSIKQVDMGIHKLEISQRECVPAKGAIHAIDNSHVNDSKLQMKIFEDSFSNDIPKNNQPLVKNDGEAINPFDEELIAKLLNNINFPGAEKKHYRIARAMPNHWKPGSVVQMGSKSWEIAGMLGKGSYAKVVKGLLKGENKCSKPVAYALKVQKPSWVWELYISCQIHKRLSDPSLATAFMKVDEFYKFNNGSVFSCEYIEYGTILDVANRMHSPANVTKSMIEAVTMHFTMELLQILDALQKCRIIHADIKPDNFLLRSLLTKEQCTPTIQLIDYGRAIDMSLFPEGTTFTQVVTTEGFKCVEMQGERPWTYQTDLYGMASTVHCLFFGDYMNTYCQGEVWNITKKIPRGSKSPKLWLSFFHEMLNIKSCEHMPDLSELWAKFDEEIDKKRLASSINAFKNLILEN